MIALIGAALAQDSVAQGVTVEITGVGRKDAYWRARDWLIGVRCVVDDPGLYPQSRKWLSGQLTCEDGATYYFFQVSVAPAEWDPSEVLQGGVEGGVEGGVAADGGVEDGATLGLVGALGSGWPVGARVKLTDVSAADARYGEKAKLVGKACTVAEAPLQESGTGWWTGAVKCDDGADYFFYQVAVADAGDGLAAVFGQGNGAAIGGLGVAGVAVPKADGRLSGGSVPAGKMVRVVDVAAVDALGAERTRLVWHACSVVEAPLLPTGDGWFAGRLFCDDGQSYQFYQVAVTPK